MKAGHKLVAKTATWRFVGALKMFALVYWMTGETTAAAGFMAAMFAVETALYFGHELVWNYVPVRVKA